MSSLFSDTEDDVSLRTRRDTEDRADTRRRSAVEMDDAPAADREVTLNTGTVLALFFTLALICAVFFGFGYSMGRKSALPVAGTAAEGTTTAASTVDNSKPAPGSPAIQPIPGYMSQDEANEANAKAGAQTTRTPVATTRTALAETPSTTAVKPVAPPRNTAAEAVPVSIPPVSTGPLLPGATFVQIAAVSHQEDADVLLNALRRRGYKVIERSDTGDHLIHVQIGPFNDRKAAEQTRQKLLSDGYNAFLK